jgi:hypothetical protein
LNQLIDYRWRKWSDDASQLIQENRMSFEEALLLASRDEGFKATVYAMNTLLIQKGIYAQGEFQALFVEWVEKEPQPKVPEKSRAQASTVFSA